MPETYTRKTIYNLQACIFLWMESENDKFIKNALGEIGLYQFILKQ